MEPISLSLPDMTPEEHKTAALWQKVNRIRNAVNNHEAKDPEVILDLVGSMFS